jgi:DNA-binding NtrC family response regulator
MLNRRPESQDIMLYGLESSLASELAGVLTREGHAFRSASFDPMASGVKTAIDSRTGLVFCSADRATYAHLLHQIEQEALGLPVVVVSRRPATEEWLNAIEAGAADYCCAPFETFQISWIIDNTLKYRHSTAA